MTKSLDRYIQTIPCNVRVLPLLLSVLTVLAGCSGDDVDEQPAPKLDIHIYAPGKMEPTRSGETVKPVTGEDEIKTLQLWLYDSNTSNLLGSLNLGTTDVASLNSTGAQSYSMELPSTFAYGPNPLVDVYVLANTTVGNCGIAAGGNATLSELESLKIGSNYFQPTPSVPGDGLPMSGVMRRQNIVQRNDVFHLNEANLMLKRAVSKIRFVFSSLTGGKSLQIKKVTFDAGKMYKDEYLFLQDAPYRVGNDKNTEELKLLDEISGNIATNDDPTQYAYKSGETVANYEKRIENALSEDSKPLTASQWLYLRESDQKLTGKIYFTVGGNGPEHTATFSMVGSDFRRNQTWIVYAYYIGSTRLVVNSVQVTNWEEKDPLAQHEIYNW